MRQSKPMAREVLARLVKWLEGSTTMTTGRWNTEFWQEALALDLITHHSFSQAFSHAVQLLPAPWAYKRRKGKHGWEYRFWREEPKIIPTPAGPEIVEEMVCEGVEIGPEGTIIKKKQSQPQRLTPEEFCRRECPGSLSSDPERARSDCRSGINYSYPGCSPFDTYFGIDRVKQEEPQPAERPACPADFIHKGAVRKRLIDMLLDPGAALDITLLNYVRELED